MAFNGEIRLGGNTCRHMPRCETLCEAPSALVLSLRRLIDAHLPRLPDWDLTIVGRMEDSSAEVV